MKKDGKKKKIVGWIVAGVVAFVVLFAFSFLLGGQKTIQNMEIADASAVGMVDGVYTGSFDGYRWSNTLEVTIAGGVITDIRILKDQKIEVPEVPAELFANVIEKQSLAVDAVSGATLSSKAYLKAMEAALTGGN